MRLRQHPGLWAACVKPRPGRSPDAWASRLVAALRLPGPSPGRPVLASSLCAPSHFRRWSSATAVRARPRPRWCRPGSSSWRRSCRRRRPPAVSSWLGIAALALALWPLGVDVNNPAAFAVGYRPASTQAGGHRDHQASDGRQL